jgi:hypothetical protein
MDALSRLIKALTDIADLIRALHHGAGLWALDCERANPFASLEDIGFDQQVEFRGEARVTASLPWADLPCRYARSTGCYFLSFSYTE